MIALCSMHHSMADAGSFTHEQLRQMKAKGTPDGTVQGRFEWLRNELLAIVGGSLYYKTSTILTFRGEQAIWFNRDVSGYFLLNIRMITTSRQPRLRLDDNDWVVRGEPMDFECPPSGKRIFAKYQNGDELTVEFHELTDSLAAVTRYPHVPSDRWPRIAFPVTVVEVQSQIGGTDLGFGPTWTRLPGLHLKDGFFVGGSTAILIS
jgi:hypothetical protein